MVEETCRITPNEQEVINLSKEVRSQFPEYGIKRMLASILQQQPSWVLSEKRLKKILAQSTNTATSTLIKPGNSDIYCPFPNVIPKFIDNTTGKGLFTTKPFQKGQILFSEKPLLFFPGWETIRALDREGIESCSTCYRMIPPHPHPLSKLAKHCKDCRVPFCSKSCFESAQETGHALLCSQKNPAMDNLLQALSAECWNAGMGATKMLCHIVFAYCQSESLGQQVEQRYRSFCVVSERVRLERSQQDLFSGEAVEMLWERSHSLLLKALSPPPKTTGIAPLSLKYSEHLLSIERWLEFVGTWNLNNQDGGLYTIQSCINHSCTPNVAIKHPGTTSKALVEVVALRNLKEGEQLFETYADPTWNKEMRQGHLFKSYLFSCQCQRCVEDVELDPELQLLLK